MLGVILDPAWALPAQTALIIVLTLINAWHNRRTARRVDRTQREVVDVKRATGLTRRAEDPDPCVHASADRDTMAAAGMDTPKQPDPNRRRVTD